MDPTLFPQALTYVRQVQAKIAGNRRRYDEFVQTLQLFRLQIMDSSAVISTVHTILDDHQTLLDGFMPFIPKNLASAAAAQRADAEDAKVRSCVDFLNRVGTRFNGGRAYRKFLEYCSHAHDHKREEKDMSERVFQLFGENYDLYEEFLRFLPDCREGLTGQYFTLPQRGTKMSRDDEETFAGDEPPCRPSRRRRKEKAAKNVVDEDCEMEDRLCETDVDIEKLEGCRMRAKYLTGNKLSPANVHLHCYFTPSDLAVIRSLAKRFLEVIGGENMVHALGELEEVLKKKRESLVRERVEIVQRWNRIRQNR